MPRADHLLPHGAFCSFLVPFLMAASLLTPVSSPQFREHVPEPGTWIMPALGRMGLFGVISPGGTSAWDSRTVQIHLISSTRKPLIIKYFRLIAYNRVIKKKKKKRRKMFSTTQFSVFYFYNVFDDTPWGKHSCMNK